MDTCDVIIGIILLSQTVAGILGNFFLIYHYLMLYFTGCFGKQIDLILQHLTIANSLTLLCRGVPQTMAAFGFQDFLGDWGCKILFYLHRVSRGVSISSACLLSVFQAMTISPRDSIWAQFKAKAHRYIDSSIYLIWILYLIRYTGILRNVTGNRRNRNTTGLKVYGHCSSIQLDKTAEILMAVFMSFPDVVCMGLMLWTSSCIVLLLHRHKQRMQNIRGAAVCPRSSPETRATKTVLLLVSTFVSSYTLSCVFQLFFILLYNSSAFLQHMAILFAGCFPTVSPFLLLSHVSSTYRLCFMWIQNR